MRDFSRRTFLTVAGGAAALNAVGPARRSAGANERVRHAVIGTGGQGCRHARTFHSFDDCEIVALCDVDPERRARCSNELGGGIQEVEDYRRILDDPSIDSVSIATPDHWHTLAALAALDAGKHVYVEKPCSHNVHEGVVLVDAAKKSGKCVQHGTQSRSSEGIQRAVAFLRDGGIGTVRAAKAINHQLRGPIGRAEVSVPPAGVNYDLWLGPAPEHPFTENRWHYKWHWFWDYGTGDIGNDGIHQIDVARWGLGVGLPNAVGGSGAQLFYDDDHETPDTQTVVFEYDGCHLLYEMRLWTNYKLEGHDNGTVFYGDEGTLEVGRPGCVVKRIGEEPKTIGGGKDFEANLANFIACIRNDSPDKLNSPIDEGAISAALAHLGNISTRVGQRLVFDSEKMKCAGSDAANALLKRTYRSGYELPAV